MVLMKTNRGIGALALYKATAAMADALARCWSELMAGRSLIKIDVEARDIADFGV